MQLQSRSFPSTQLIKIPRIKINHLERNWKKTLSQNRLYSREKFVFSTYQALKFADFFIGCCFLMDFYCQTLVNIFVVKTQTFHTFTLLYLTLLVYLQLWFWREMLQPKGMEAVSFLKYERQKSQGCIRRVVLLMGLCAIYRKLATFFFKGETIFYSKTSYTKVTLATRIFKRIKALARYKMETWCTDLAHVDKLSNDKSAVKQ